MQLLCGDKILDLSHARVMGVLNITPDSFSDGGRYFDAGAAIDHACRMVEEGAAIIDVGGESTRPGAGAVEAEEELRRVLPVVKALVQRVSVPVSVDTCKPAVMRAVLDAGASMINDVRALREPGALAAMASSGAGLCLMHMQGEPRTMQNQPQYADVVTEVRDFLAERLASCRAAGVAGGRLVVDPGFGFGKTLAHNLTLLNGLERMIELGVPVLVGLSRKSMLGTILGKPQNERLYGGLALATAAVLKGARLVRTHDVGPTVDAVRVATALVAGGTS